MQLSIAIPTRNRNEYLALLLDSVRHVADEIVVRDNAGGAARPLVERYPEVKWMFGPELPIFENWRACLDAASSEFVAIPSDDDLYFPSLGPVLTGLGQDVARADVVIAGHRLIDSEGRTMGEWRPPRHEILAPPGAFVRFQYGVPARMPSVFFRNAFLRRIGSLDPSFRLTAADSELVQRALLHGTVAFVPEIVAGYRVWPGGLTDKTQMSELWLSEIERWSAKLAPVATRELGRAHLRFDARRYADELFGTNLLAGVSRAYGRGEHGEALRFLDEVRFPWHARPATKLALARVLLMATGKAAWERLARRDGRRAP